jgi:hypothetical protein
VYCASFNLVRFMPKTAFSALLVLGAVDTLGRWLCGSFLNAVLQSNAP